MNVNVDTCMTDERTACLHIYKAITICVNMSDFVSKLMQQLRCL